MRSSGAAAAAPQPAPQRLTYAAQGAEGRVEVTDAKGRVNENATRSAIRQQMVQGTASAMQQASAAAAPGSAATSGAAGAGASATGASGTAEETAAAASKARHGGSKGTAAKGGAKRSGNPGKRSGNPAHRGGEDTRSAKQFAAEQNQQRGAFGQPTGSRGGKGGTGKRG